MATVFTGVGILLDVESLEQDFSIDQYSTDIEALLSRALGAQASLEDAVRKSTVTFRDYTNLNNSLVGIRAEMRVLRDDLNTYVYRRRSAFVEGAADLAHKSWERNARASLDATQAALVDIESLARTLAQSDPGKTHVVTTGDTLQSIAQLHFGDFSRWRIISEHNGLVPGPLTVGTILRIPNV